MNIPDGVKVHDETSEDHGAGGKKSPEKDILTQLSGLGVDAQKEQIVNYLIKIIAIIIIIKKNIELLVRKETEWKP